MTALFGWVGFTLSPEQVAATLGQASGFSATEGLHAAPSFNGPLCGLFGRGEGIDGFRENDAAVLVAGNPRWCGPDASNAGDGLARRILQGYRTSGIEILRFLGGTFSLALALNGGRDALLAVDRIGIASLAYCPTQGGVVFGSSSDLVNACLGERAEIDPQSLFNYIFLHMVPGPTTIYRGQFRIPPGGYVRIKDGRIESGNYWRMKYEERDDLDLRELKLEFRSLLERSVGNLLDGRPVGTFLSGGTDSSTVTGLLAQFAGKGVRSYSIGFEAQGYDEMKYARIASRHFGTDHHEYYVTPEDVLAFAPRLAASCDQPFGNASAVPTYYCAHLAQSDGIELLLGGDGGDELFGGNERYATQSMFSWYERLPAVLRRRAIEPLLFNLPGIERAPLLRKGRGYVKQAMVTMPDRLHAYNMIRRNPLNAIFTGEFLNRIDPETPMILFRSVYDSVDARSPLNRHLGLDLQYTLADNDLYKVSRMCELAGLNVAYPMLNDDLVAFSARLPSHLKLKGTKLRYFFKEALKDFLPPEIIAKHKHGFGLPIGVWMRSHEPLRDLVYSAVTALGARGVVRPEFIERIMIEHQSAQAAYWGAEIWVLSQLEFWLRAHGRAPGQPLI